MPFELPSRVFSSVTLMGGLESLEAGEGMDDLGGLPAHVLEEELQKLEACF